MNTAFSTDQEPSLDSGTVGILLGIDIGDVRIGVAINDDIGFGAHALRTIQSKGRKQDVRAIHDIIEEYSASGVVVGIPRMLDGSIGVQAEKAQRFVAALREAIEIPVFTWDERLTTAEAERILLTMDVSRRKRKLVIDQIAAALMLEAFLTYHRNRPEQ